MGFCRSCRNPTDYFCFVHKRHVCDDCVVNGQHTGCVVKPYKAWVMDPEYEWPPQCLICQQQMLPPENGGPSDTTRCPCKHLFHTACLDEFARNSGPRPTCPECTDDLIPRETHTALSQQMLAHIKAANWPVDTQISMGGSGAPPPAELQPTVAASALFSAAPAATIQSQRNPTGGAASAAPRPQPLQSLSITSTGATAPVSDSSRAFSSSLASSSQPSHLSSRKKGAPASSATLARAASSADGANGEADPDDDKYSVHLPMSRPADEEHHPSSKEKKKHADPLWIMFYVIVGVVLLMFLVYILFTDQMSATQTSVTLTTEDLRNSVAPTTQ